MSKDPLVQNLSGALSLFAERADAIFQKDINPSTMADDTVEEYVHKLRFYLPVDFGNAENNEYMGYLEQTCCENYKNGK